MPPVKPAHQIGRELPGDEGIELRFAVQALAEIERHLAVPEIAVRRQDVEQQLEAGVAQTRRHAQESFPPDHEEAGQRIGDVAAEHEAAEPVADFREAEAKGAERRNVDAFVEAPRGADDVGARRRGSARSCFR